MMLNELKQTMLTLIAMEVGERTALPPPMGALPIPLEAQVVSKEVLAGGRTVMVFNADLLGVHFAELHLDSIGTNCTWRVTQ